MPFIYSFFTWFSVRLGSIIVAAITLIQGTIMLTFAIMAFVKREKMSQRIKAILKNNDMLFLTAYFRFTSNYPGEVFAALWIFSIIFCFTCFLLIHGAYKMKIIEIFPFVFCEFLRLVLITFLYATGIALIKKNILDFNILIVSVMGGGFIILLLWYMWLCPTSLIQCIQLSRKLNVQKEIETAYQLKIKSKGKSNKIFDINHNILYHNYLSDFKLRAPVPRGYNRRGIARFQ